MVRMILSKAPTKIHMAHYVSQAMSKDPLDPDTFLPHPAPPLVYFVYSKVNTLQFNIAFSSLHLPTEHNKDI